MLKSKYEKYIVKRSLIVLLLFAVMDLVFVDDKIYALCGLLIGSAVSIVKLVLVTALFSKMITRLGKGAVVGRSIIVYTASQIVTALLFVFSIIINLALLIGVAEGVLLIPLTIFFICITGGSGIIRNNFE